MRLGLTQGHGIAGSENRLEGEKWRCRSSRKTRQGGLEIAARAAQDMLPVMDLAGRARLACAAREGRCSPLGPLGQGAACHVT